MTTRCHSHSHKAMRPPPRRRDYPPLQAQGAARAPQGLHAQPFPWWKCTHAARFSSHAALLPDLHPATSELHCSLYSRVILYLEPSMSVRYGVWLGLWEIPTVMLGAEASTCTSHSRGRDT